MCYTYTQLIWVSLNLSVIFFFLTYFLTGFVYLQEVIAIGVITNYFDKYYNIAVATYSCGAGFGIITMPLFTQILMDIYGWRGALLLLSGLSMHFIPCGSLIIQRSSGHDEQKVSLLSSVADNPSNQNLGKDASSSECSKSKFLKELNTIISSPSLTNLPFMAQICVPGIVWGYAYTGWLIYIVSFAVSNDVSMSDASLVSTCGGIGLTAIRALLPLLNNLMTYKHLMFISSVISAVSLAATIFFNTFTGMCLMSLLFGAGFGILGSELYIAIKEITSESEYLNAVALANLIHCFAAIASGFCEFLEYFTIRCIF